MSRALAQLAHGQAMAALDREAKARFWSAMAVMCRDKARELHRTSQQLLAQAEEFARELAVAEGRERVEERARERDGWEQARRKVEERDEQASRDTVQGGLDSGIEAKGSADATASTARRLDVADSTR